MRTFQDNFEPIKILIKSKDGKEFILNSLFMDGKRLKRIELISQGKEKFETNIDSVFAILKLMFGRDDQFWEQFSISLLADIAKYLPEEFKKKDLKMPDSTDSSSAAV